MINPEVVPHAAMNALLLALRQRRGGKEAIAAAMNAWPGMHHYEPNAEPYYGKHLILPLPPQEKRDDER